VTLTPGPRRIAQNGDYGPYEKHDNRQWYMLFKRFIDDPPGHISNKAVQAKCDGYHGQHDRESKEQGIKGKQYFDDEEDE
jgi:hypothetical protein